MTENPFYRLSPFIQDYIYRNGWETLREVQVKACDVVFNSDKNLLLSAGTASGKTEAAFLPALTLLDEKPSSSIGILYVSPLKALINDQFYRLSGLLEEAHISVTKWHGDVSQSTKNRLVKKPEGVLQITPESLEGMLMHRKSAIVKLFGDLRFVVIDEVHQFMSCPRGVQLLCLLERLGRLAGVNPRRIGLSATLGDYSSVEQWLDTGSGRGVLTPQCSQSGQKIRLSVEHFTLLHPELKDGELSTVDREYFDYIYNNTYGKKSIIFSDTKMELERIMSTLKELCEEKKDEDVFLVHHGNISASLRESTELMMKKSELPLVTGATVTLELGIDIGSLERIMQLGAPYSVSSFVQRLGRSGRRGDPCEMWFACYEYQHLVKETVFQQIDWNYLRCLAIIELYVRERFIEPIAVAQKPFSLLYHQTMSELVSLGEATPAYLAQRVLTLKAFSHITPEEFKQQLLYMLEIGHIEKSERDTLYVGLNAEFLVNDYQFLAVFNTPDLYSVRCESEEIGSVEVKFPVGERFALAGHTWEVTELDEKNKVLYVKFIKGRSNNLFEGSGFLIHTRILQKIRELLLCDEQFPYLQGKAVETLSNIRHLSQGAGIGRYTVLPLGGDEYCILPWVGTRAFVTLMMALRRSGVNIVQKYAPYWMTVRTGRSAEEIYALLHQIQANPRISDIMIGEHEVEDDQGVNNEEKFSKFVPLSLRQVEFRTDFLAPEDLCTNICIE